MKKYLLALMVACLPMEAIAEELVEEVVTLEEGNMKFVDVGDWSVTYAYHRGTNDIDIITPGFTDRENDMRLLLMCKKDREFIISFEKHLFNDDHVPPYLLDKEQFELKVSFGENIEEYITFDVESSGWKNIDFSINGTASVNNFLNGIISQNHFKVELGPSLSKLFQMETVEMNLAHSRQAMKPALDACGIPQP